MMTLRSRGRALKVTELKIRKEWLGANERLQKNRQCVAEQSREIGILAEQIQEAEASLLAITTPGAIISADRLAAYQSYIYEKQLQHRDSHEVLLSLENQLADAAMECERVEIKIRSIEKKIEEEGKEVRQQAATEREQRELCEEILPMMRGR